MKGSASQGAMVGWVVEGSECEPWHGNIDPGGGREVGKHVEGRGSLLIRVS